MRRLHTAVPPFVWRSSGSRVRFPVKTTLLMFVAAMRLLPPVLLEDRRSRLHTHSERSVAEAQERALKSGFFRGGVTWVTARDAPPRAEHGRSGLDRSRRRVLPEERAVELRQRDGLPGGPGADPVSAVPALVAGVSGPPGGVAERPGAGVEEERLGVRLQ